MQKTLIGSGFVSLLWFSHLLPVQATGECTAPTDVQVTTVEGLDREYWMYFNWDAYDFSLCAAGTTTAGYDIEITSASGDVVFTKTVTKTSTKIGVDQPLHNNTAYRFRVRAIADNNQASGWSDEKSFETPLPKVKLTINSVSYNQTKHTSRKKFTWTRLYNIDLNYAEFKLYRLTYTPTGDGLYTETSKRIVFKRYRSLSRTSTMIRGIKDYKSNASNKRYYYMAIIDITYTVDGTLKSNPSILYFRVDRGKADTDNHNTFDKSKLADE